MGSLTTVTFYNDGIENIKSHPEQLAERIYEACLGVPPKIGNQVSLGNHCNMITVQKPRHADSWAVYVHAGNSVTEVSTIKDKDDLYIDAAIVQMEYELKRLKKLKASKSEE